MARRIRRPAEDDAPRRRPRLRRILLILAAVLVLAVAVPWFAPVLRVSAVAVRGAERQGDEAVVAAADVPEGANLLRVDLDRVARDVAGLPWVARAEADRSWPDTVTVTVTERRPVLYLGEGEQAHLIDDKGVDFLRGAPPPGTIQLVESPAQRGSAIPGEVVAALLDAVNALDPGLRGEVASVTAPSPVEIEFTMRDGRTVYWGSAERAREKARAMRIVLDRPAPGGEGDGEPAPEGRRWDVSDPELATVR